MRPRSLSVACDRADIKYSKKFEGVTSDHEDDSDSDENGEPVLVVAEQEEFSLADYNKLVAQIRAVLPNNDTRKAEYRLKQVDWDRVAFDHFSADTVKKVACKLISGIRKFRTLDEMLDDLVYVAKKSLVAAKPKGPASAYAIFMKENIRLIREENPEVPHKSLFPLVAAQFKTLPSKKKRKYEQLAEESKKNFKEQMEKFYIENPAARDVLEEPKKKSKSSETKSPKVSEADNKITPFNLFKKAKKEEGLQLSHNDLKKLWAKVPHDSKLEFIRAAYSAESAKLTKDEKKLLACAQGKPEVVPRTAAEYYIRKYVPQDGSLTVAKWRKQAMAQFKDLPKLRKLELEVELHRARANYVSSYQEYISNLPPAERAEEVKFLQSYMDGTMNKGHKRNKDDGRMPDLTGFDTHNANDTTDLPIAESTTNDLQLGRSKKSKKKAALPPPANEAKGTPLKSILKSPDFPAVAPSPKRKADIPQEPTSTQSASKKKKLDKIAIESESDSNAKKGKKKAKKEKGTNNGVDSSQDTVRNGSQEARVAIKEPKRPPKDILKYYKKHHYFGRPGQHKESFDKLSSIRKKTIEVEMRAAQKKYMVDLKKYLDQLPPSEVQSYVAKLKKFVSDVTSADEQDSDDSSVKKTLQTTKQEPNSSSDDDEDDLSDE